MKKLLNINKWIKLIIGFLLLSLGIITLIICITKKGDDDIFVRILSLVFAFYCFVIGLISLIVILISEKNYGHTRISSALLITGFLIGFGIFLCFLDIVVLEWIVFIEYILPCILLGIGAVIFVKWLINILDYRSRRDVGGWVLELIIWVSLIALGILFLVVQEKAYIIIFTIISIVLIILGILMLVASLVALAYENKIKKLSNK